MSESRNEAIGRIGDKLVEVEGLGDRTPLPESWCPGDACPATGAPCERATRCWSEGACALRATLTSDLAAEAGRYLAHWAEESGAEGMCAGCAFREGTRANRTDQTIIDIVESLTEGKPFYCHDGVAHGEAPQEVCRGWSALRTRRGNGKP